jgi:signal transduction histidine kinase
MNQRPHFPLLQRKRIAAASASVVVLLLGGIVGICAIIFAAYELHTLYQHNLFPELEEPKQIPVTGIITHLRQNIHGESDLRDKSKLLAAVGDDTGGVFIKDFLVADAAGNVIYSTSNDPKENAFMCDGLNESGILTGTPGVLDTFHGEKLDIVCRRRPIYGSDGKLIGAFVLHRALYPMPAKLKAIERRFFVSAAVMVGLLSLALGLAMASAVGLIRKSAVIHSRNQRLQSMNAFTSGLAHEIKNPLNAMALTSQYLKQLMEHKRKKENSPLCEAHAEVEKNLGVFRDEMERVKTILADFLNFARPIKLVKEYAPLKEILQHSANVFEQELKGKSIALDLHVGDDFSLVADKMRLQQVFVNLIKNAMEADDGKGGKITVSAARKRGMAEIIFKDTGKGMTPEQMAHLFEPYYTTKTGGQGLGLPICKNIVESHGGNIQAASAPGQGATFTISLPISG